MMTQEDDPTQYHKIETLFERDDRTHRLREPLVLKNRIYGALKTWHWTEKVNGTNIRCVWDPIEQRFQFAGKSQQSQIPADLVEWLRLNVTPDKMRESFDTTTLLLETIVIYGEGYGAGIQKGGGYRQDKQLIVFDVKVGEWWLAEENVRDVCCKLGLECVPSFGEAPLGVATDWVRAGLRSKMAGSDCMAEGLVGRPVETLFDKKGARLIVKLKTRDFAAGQP